MKVRQCAETFVVHCTTQLHTYCEKASKSEHACSPQPFHQHTQPPSSGVGKNNSTCSASTTPHTLDAYFQAASVCPLLTNREWISAHQGVQNNGWGTVGNIVAKAPWGIVFTRKPNMHILLCGGQKLSNQCCYMGDNSINIQMCCQAFNGHESESTIAYTTGNTWTGMKESQIDFQINTVDT